MDTNQEATALLEGLNQRQSGPQHLATGVVVFNSTGQLLFMNQASQVYLRQMRPCSTKESGASMIPEPIHSVARGVLLRSVRPNVNGRVAVYAAVLARFCDK